MWPILDNFLEFRPSNKFVQIINSSVCQIPGVCLPATSGQATTIAGQSSSTNNLATQPRVGAACQSVGVHGDQGAAVDAAAADLRASAASPHAAAATHAVAASSQTAAGPQAARAASLSEQDILGAR